MFCSKCGYRLHGEVFYCPSCGNQTEAKVVKKSDTTSTEPFFASEMNDGEIHLYNFLKSKLDDNNILIPNLMLKKNNGGSNQIDLIIVNNKGIFVLEYKDIKGKVYGYDHSKEWTVVYNKYEKHKILNPIKQNDNHIKTLHGILKEKNINCPIYNLVVFSDEADITKINSTSHVMKIYDVVDLITTFPESTFDYLKSSDVIKEKNIILLDERNEHLNYINSIKNKNDEADLDSINIKNKNFPNDYYMKNSYRKNYYFASRRQKIKLIEIIIKVSFLVLSLYLFLIFFGLSLISSNNSSSSSSNNQSIIPSKKVNYNRYIVGSGTIHIDSTKGDVLKSFGQPDRKSYSGDDWYYSEAVIYFNNSTEKVIGWKDNIQKTLRAGLLPKLDGENLILLNDSKDTVISALGAPQTIGKFSKDTWEYGNALIYFDYSGKVVGWKDDNLKTLRNVMPQKKEGSKAIREGSSKEEVLASLGAPQTIGKFSKDTWEYESVSIKFDTKNKVIKIINL